MDILRIRNMILYFKHLTPHPLQSPWTADLARERPTGGRSRVRSVAQGWDWMGGVKSLKYFITYYPEYEWMFYMSLL